jgi:non-specific serine/threonine protein kinase
MVTQRDQQDHSGMLAETTSSPAWLRMLEQEEDNLRAALGFAVAEPACGEQGLHLAAALWPFWLWRGALREGRRWLTLALAASGTMAWQQAAAGTLTTKPLLYRVRAEALYGAGRLAEQQGAQAQARAFFEECVALCHALQDEQGEARARTALSNLPPASSAQPTSSQRAAGSRL